MRKFVRNIVLLIVIVYAVDLIFSLMLDFGRPNDYRAFIKSKQTYKRYNNETQLLFLGDSHTADAFVPATINEITGKNTFNFGVYHISPIEGYFILKDVIKRSKKLEFVVLGTNPIMFNREVTEGKYTPMFIKNYLTLFELLTVTNCKNLSVITRSGKKLDLFVPMVKKLFANYKSNVVREVQNIDHGYLENTKCFNNIKELNCNNKIYKNSSEIVHLQVEYFIKTIDFLEQKNIKVIIANPPLNSIFFDDIKDSNLFKDYSALLDSIAETNNIEIYNRNYSNNSLNFVNEDFLNGEHLCYSGAVKNSKRFADFYNLNFR